MNKKFSKLQLVFLLFLIGISALVFIEVLRTNQEPKKLQSAEKTSPIDCSNQALSENQSENQDLLATLTNQPEDNQDSCLFVGCRSFF